METKKAMKAGKNYIRTQLLGMKRLPHENGAWGFLLPRGKEQATHEADAHDQIQDINAAYHFPRPLKVPFSSILRARRQPESLLHG
ncbi:hypothetical protein [Cupriavidus alkaliphilus]|uniref:hypothetical protein n=1 Tax=Cupriavidus alkaliphilus TaxID=942866 RepID=UPI001057E788|nr:hypothetical protein [Cupriavidus alkaliphilus]